MKNVMLICLALGAVIISAGIGCYCDAWKKIKAPTLYWTIGFVAGAIEGALLGFLAFG